MWPPILFCRPFFRSEITRTPPPALPTPTQLQSYLSCHTVESLSAQKIVVHKQKRLTFIGVFYTVIGMLHIRRFFGPIAGLTGTPIRFRQGFITNFCVV